MRSSSPRLRLGGALAATSLTLVFGFGSTAIAEQGQGQGDEHRNERAGARADAPDASTPEPTPAATEDNDTNDGGTPNNVVDTGDDRHPSGKDRSVEAGGSGNQGNATSEPDQDGKGPERDTNGLDKPGGPGGADRADQDGNNGCGNDDDFEDDNEGLCGGRAKSTTPPPVVETPTERGNPVVVVDGSAPVTPAVVLASQTPRVDAPAAARVLGVVVERPTAAAAAVDASATPAVAGSPSVLGATVVRGAGLARTGLSTLTLVLAASVLLIAGFAMVRRPKGSHFIA